MAYRTSMAQNRVLQDQLTAGIATVTSARRTRTAVAVTVGAGGAGQTATARSGSAIRKRNVHDHHRARVVADAATIPVAAIPSLSAGTARGVGPAVDGALLTLRTARVITADVLIGISVAPVSPGAARASAGLITGKRAVGDGYCSSVVADSTPRTVATCTAGSARYTRPTPGRARGASPPRGPVRDERTARQNQRPAIVVVNSAAVRVDTIGRTDRHIAAKSTIGCCDDAAVVVDSSAILRSTICDSEIAQRQMNTGIH